MKKILGRIGLWMLWGFLVFIGALHLHFPEDEIVEGMPYMVETASDGEWALDVGGASLWWLNGAVIEDVVLYSVEKPKVPKKKRRGRKGSRNDEPEDEPVGEISLKPFLNIDRARASVSPMSLVFGDTLDIDFDMSLHGGELEGNYQRGAEHYDVTWNSTETLNVEGLPLELPGLLTIAGTGSFLTKGNLKRHANQAKKDSGDFSFEFQQLFADQMTFSFAGIDAKVFDATFSRAAIVGTIQNGKLSLSEGALISDKVELNLSGDMTMNNKDMDTWKVRFEMTMNPLGDELLKILSFAPQSMKSAVGEDGVYYFICSGTWGTMECNPNRSVVGGAQVPSTPKTSSRRSSTSARRTTARSEDDVDEDDDSTSRADAEDRRQERLERIRERREERRLERENARDGEDEMDDEEIGPEFNDPSGEHDFPEGMDMPPILPEDEMYPVDDGDYFDDDLPPEDPDGEFIDD
jgi:type II secretion system protein N